MLLLTAKFQQQEKLIGLSAGADDYLSKPFDMNELQIRLTNLIQSRIALKSAYQQYSNQGIEADTHLPDKESQFLTVLREYIIERISDPTLYVADLAAQVHMSERTLNRKLKALSGETPKQLLLSVRLGFAAQLLDSSELSITEVSHTSGFSDASYFSRKFKEHFSQTPKQYRHTKHQTEHSI